MRCNKEIESDLTKGCQEIWSVAGVMRKNLGTKPLSSSSSPERKSVNGDYVWCGKIPTKQKAGQQKWFH